MRDAPLVIPFLIDSPAAEPFRIASSSSTRLKGSWTSQRYGRRAAVVDRYNSLWIYTEEDSKGKGRGKLADGSTEGDAASGRTAPLSIAVPDITLDTTSSAHPGASAASAESTRTHTPTTPTFSSAGPSSSTKPHRPSQLRSHSSASVARHSYGNLGLDPGSSAAHRSRAASNASSILSSGSHYRRASALSPPSGSPRVGTTALTTETALADPHAGHRHGRTGSLTGQRGGASGDSGARASMSSVRASTDQAGRASLSDNAELLDQLKYQCRPVSPSTDRGIGLGIGFGLGSRNLAVHGKASEEDPTGSAEADTLRTDTGTLSPRSTHSTESNRTFSNRFMPWRSDDTDSRAAHDRDKLLMEKVAEVDVEREMEREVAEDERERVEEKLVRDAQDAVTPRESMVIDNAAAGRFHGASGQRGTATTRRVILPDRTFGSAVRLLVEQSTGALLVLRDTGVLDIVSLDTEKHISSLRIEQLDDGRAATGSGGNPPFKLHKHWKWQDVQAVTVDQERIIIAHGVPWSSGGMPSPNGQLTRIVMLRHAHVTGVSGQHAFEHVAELDLAGVGSVKVDPSGPSILHSTATSTFAYPIHSPSSHPAPSSRASSSLQVQHGRSVSALHPSGPTAKSSAAASSVGLSTSPQDGLKRHRSQLLPRDAEHSSGAKSSSSWGRDGERGFAKFLGIKKGEVKDAAPAEVGWGIGPGEEITAAVNRVGIEASAAEAAPEEALRAQEEYPSPIKAILPFDVETCFVADRNGEITKQRFADVLSGTLCPADTPTVDRLASAVTCITIVQTERGLPYLIAGDEDGIVRVWDAHSFELLAMISLFAFPVVSINLLDMPQAGTLRGQVICTSKAGTIALVSLDEMEQSFLIPAARDPLRRLFVGGKDIMMIYANGKARVWNVETLEFRRSTALDAAEDMLNVGDWAEIDMTLLAATGIPLRTTVMQVAPGADTSRLLELDLRLLGSWLRQQRTNSAEHYFNSLRAVLPLFLTRGIERSIDKLCEEGLGVTWPSADVAAGDEISKAGAIALTDQAGLDVWRISPEATGMRQLAIVALLRPFLDSPVHEASAAQAIALCTAALPADTVDADLRFFARYYLDSSHDIHLAARILFDSRMDRMPAEEVEAIAEEYMAGLPSHRPRGTPSNQDDAGANMALTVLGGMALHRYQNITPAALKAVAESITIYLSSNDPTKLGLAIELASKGFSTWQTFTDPAELLRRMFYLSTHNIIGSSDNSTGISNSSIAAQARIAVLHVASTNPALFMSTLSMDILDAKSVEGRKSIMKLCVYMARKKPEVLENSLPKIVEAVVKSLDPNVGKMREDVQQTATVILSELVLAFTTVDFHSGSQRLAMGTHEGAVIMYDLKTASRLYVLEPHKYPVSAVMFSPDGRRLVTVSLEEGDITVWKVGSSLSGFFNVGGPPRQGGERGEPFKRIDFARADNGPLRSTTALSDIQITWPGQKQVKVVIKETALTFET